MDCFRATTCIALLLVVLATVSGAPQSFEGGFNRFPQGPNNNQGQFYYDDSEDNSSSDELTFFQRLIRPWRWFDPVYDFFSGDSDEEEVYDEGNFPDRFPGQQLARLDQRPAFRPAAGQQQQRYVARPPLRSGQQFQTARSDSAAYEPEQLAAKAMNTEVEHAGGQA